VTGYHEVKVFYVVPSQIDTLTLPEGWKPFSVIHEWDGSGLIGIVCRKWHRAEPTKS
jgi:hypothetical protein